MSLSAYVIADLQDRLVKLEQEIETQGRRIEAFEARLEATEQRMGPIRARLHNRTECRCLDQGYDGPLCLYHLARSVSGQS